MDDMRSPRRVVIVGGGAGGLAAAVAAGRLGARVSILEKANRVGKKLLKTGNGRCNLSNRNISPEGYNCPEFVATLLSRIGPRELLEWFAELGLWPCEDEEGRVYPRSDTASSVLDVLRLGCADVEAEEICSTEVTAILPRSEGGFRLLTRESGEFTADRVIVSAGGGTALLRPLGHRYVPFTPALCPLKTDTDPIRGLSGLRVKCAARLTRGGEEIAAEQGELLFRDHGVSGIMALDLSRVARPGDRLSLDLLPEADLHSLRTWIRSRRGLVNEEREVLTGLFHRRVGEALLRRAGGDGEKLCELIKDFPLTVEGLADTANAQVTRGGAELSAFDPLTLESRLIPGLYCVGEALDVDGRCGGFNLHWAFASGMAAGRSAAR